MAAPWHWRGGRVAITSAAPYRAHCWPAGRRASYRGTQAASRSDEMAATQRLANARK